MSTMEVPAHVYATMAAVVDMFPHTGTDDDRRAAMEKLVATLRAKHGMRWVWKTEHATLIAPSKDGLGYVPDDVVQHGHLTDMFIWDTINGGSRKLNPAPLVSEELRKAYVLAVEPKDWLAGGDPVPVPTPGTPAEPPAQPPADSVVPEAIAEALKALASKVSALQETVHGLAARPFPEYEGRILGFAATLTPKKKP